MNSIIKIAIGYVVGRYFYNFIENSVKDIVVDAWKKSQTPAQEGKE